MATKLQKPYYKLHIIDSVRFMAIPLLDLVDNHAEGTHKIKCKHGYENKCCKMCGIKYKDCKSSLEYTDVKDDLMLYKCLFCNRSYPKKFDENVKKKSTNTCKFSNNNINKFASLL